jgi:hypothetical protein
MRPKLDKDAAIKDAIRQAILHAPRATHDAVIDRATEKLKIERWRVELVYENHFFVRDAI